MTNILRVTAMSAIAAAALLAGFIVMPAPQKALANTSPDSKAYMAHGAALQVPGKPGECNQSSWPHYKPSCLFDIHDPTNSSRDVRIVDLNPQNRRAFGDHRR